MRRHQGLHPHIGALDVCPRRLARRRRATRPRAPTRSRVGRADRRRSASRSSSTASWRASPERARARLLPQRRPGRALRGGWRRASCAPDLGPDAAPPDAPGRPWSPRGRRWPPSTSSSTAATSRSRARSPPSCARRAAGCPACGRSGCRASGERAQVSTNVHDPRGGAARRGRRRGAAGSPRRSAPGRSRPSWSGWRPRRRSRATREDVPIRGFDPRART